MIRDIEIINVQAYEYALLSLSDKLNSISGRTHSGKSSIIRAVKWALQNRPVGDKLLRDGTDNFSVSLSFNDDSSISREKNVKTGYNAYACSGIDEPLKALKTDVPDEVKVITKMGDENLQSQGDRYFLIGKTPGQVASEINKVVGLQIIDEKRSKIKSIISDLSSQVKVLKSQAVETKLKLESPEFIKADLLTPIIEKIEKNKINLSAINSKIISIKVLISSIEFQKSKVLVAKRYTSKAPIVNSLKNKIRNYKNVIKKVSDISNIVSYVNNLESNIDYFNNFLLIEPELSILKERIEIASAIRSNIDKVRNLYEDITSLKEAKIHMLQSVVEDEKLRDSLREKLKYCSKCGADRKHWKLNKVKEAI